MDLLESRILYVLLRRRRSGDGSLVPAKTLQEELVGGFEGANFSKSLSRHALKKRLVKLRKAGMVEGKVLMKDSSDPGPAPMGYRFSFDAPVITWPSTGAIVLRLHNHPEGRVGRKSFVGYLMELGLIDDTSGHALTEQDIEEQIDFCVRKGYVKEIGPTVDTWGSSEERLSTTSKVDESLMFLERLAADVKTSGG